MAFGRKKRRLLLAAIMAVLFVPAVAVVESTTDTKSEKKTDEGRYKYVQTKGVKGFA